MPRFFFHIRNGNGLTLDEEGRQLPDARAAREEALRDIRSIIADEALHGRLDLRGALEVAEGASEALFSVPFAEAFELRTGDFGPPPQRQG